MLAHALKILVEELNDHFNAIQPGNAEDTVVAGNIAVLESDADAAVKNALRNKIVATLVSLREEKTLKNTPHSKVTDALKTQYFNPPVYVNLFVLFSVTTGSYDNALIYLSRLMRFFQSKSVFTQDNSKPVSVGTPYDQMAEFKLMSEIYSPTFEELNHLWGKGYRKGVYKWKKTVMSTVFDGKNPDKGIRSPNNKNKYWSLGKYWDNSGNTIASIDHKPSVVDHWNDIGRKTDQKTRKDYFNADGGQVTLYIVPLSQNSSDGASAKTNYKYTVTKTFKGPDDKQ